MDGTEATTGVEQAAAAEQTTGNEANAADVQQVATPDAGETQEVVESEEVQGLKAAAAAERQKRQGLEAQLAVMQQAQMQQQSQPVQQTSAQAKNAFQQVQEQLGYGDAEYLTAAQTAEIAGELDNMRSVQQQQVQQQQFIAQTPDYGEVVGKTNTFGQFVPAPPLENVLRNNPGLLQSVANNPQLAYQLASTDPDYVASKQKANTVQQAATAAVVVQKQVNAGKVSISAAPGGGAIDKSAHLIKMSDEEFEVYNQNLMDRAT